MRKGHGLGWFQRKEKTKREPEPGGFTGLEGDFEAERRRAAAAAHEPTQAYENDSLDKPVFPDSTSGLTYP
ncbi:hypothetical protein E3T37_06920 [Cryobacterium sp. TMT2-10]|uniref:Uncharacterized protein n=1 Tax=Cryobacterium shii TaxID=1259235 RepID=A0AAQ2HFQ0_9MICO|nr:MULTISPECIES: hypothetical protein [Cryobacterium]TFC46384.1 hypothetical protein E3O49_09700 [Cryobacterium shii]TFC80721.1 hypothetical protein E3T24_16370 [Cryobacterium sp. TmT2-59]TFD20325.1 hypothetical protein E3T32_08990 [Cryobacterium sp. TMT2-23]TFD22369.1 hypothetical protein E3T42_00160 [Cryobacterium sp. TMT4-10]TFD39956.1 hypothetical protein E3T37_06920 [Cryobacterium sp. TMT2-10]